MKKIDRRRTVVVVETDRRNSGAFHGRKWEYEFTKLPWMRRHRNAPMGMTSRDNWINRLLMGTVLWYL